MLERLYENIGQKIKNWAKWMFVIEAISAIIAGIALIGNGEVWGFLALFAGPIVALVSTWLLYAFGELVEDIGLLRKKQVGEKMPENVPLKEHPKTTSKQAEKAKKIIRYVLFAVLILIICLFYIVSL